MGKEVKIRFIGKTPQKSRRHGRLDPGKVFTVPEKDAPDYTRSPAFELVAKGSNKQKTKGGKKRKW